VRASGYMNLTRQEHFNQKFIDFLKIENNISLISSYEGVDVSATFKCLKCSNEWKIRPRKIKAGSGCSVCARKRRLEIFILIKTIPILSILTKN
jgi:hypothetical protein